MISGPIRVLKDKTLQELGVNYDQLPSYSHTKVVVKCERCEEIFLREKRRVNQKHNCPRMLMSEKKKWCISCRKYHSLNKFNNDDSKIDGYSDHCANNQSSTWRPAVKIPKASDVRIEFQKYHPDAVSPFRKRTTDAGYDLASVVNITVPPKEVLNIETGLRISVPEGWYITIDGRSSLFKEGIVPFRGIIDSNYTGDIFIAIYNSTDKPFQIKKKDRVAQITIHKIYDVDFVEINEFSPDYKWSRGTQGWGSSGRK